MPPLRVRKSDIPLLAAAFLRRFAADNGRAIEGFTEGAQRALLGYGTGLLAIAMGIWRLNRKPDQPR